MRRNELFDYFLLRPDVIFLNHGSFGACPRPVFEVYQNWQLEAERQPVEFLGRRFNDLMQEARVALASYVNAKPDDLVYVPNATTGLNIVARSLALNPGDEILATDHEYGALDRTWQFLCDKAGATYKRQPIPVPVTSAEEFIETFWAGVTERTRVVFLSHITSPTALIFPLQEICRRAREADILSIIDGAHAVGQIPLDLQEIGVDFYSSNAHKCFHRLNWAYNYLRDWQKSSFGFIFQMETMVPYILGHLLEVLTGSLAAATFWLGWETRKIRLATESIDSRWLDFVAEIDSQMKRHEG